MCPYLGVIYPVETNGACGDGLCRDVGSPKKGYVVVGSSRRMTDGLAQSQEYKASNYLWEIGAEIQHQRQLALALGGVRPLQSGEEGPADQRWATPGATITVPRIPRQPGDGEEQAPPQAAPARTPVEEEEPPEVGVPEMGDAEERRLLEEPKADNGATEVLMEVDISAEEEASLLGEARDSYLTASLAAERELADLVDLVAPPRGRASPTEESALTVFAEAPIPAAYASTQAESQQEWDAPAGGLPIGLVTPPEELVAAPTRRRRRSRRRRTSASRRHWVADDYVSAYLSPTSSRASPPLPGPSRLVRAATSQPPPLASVVTVPTGSSIGTSFMTPPPNAKTTGTQFQGLVPIPTDPAIDPPPHACIQC